MNAPYPTSTYSAGRPTGRILVVDDEPHVLSMACTMLASQGFEADGCQSGDEAVSLLSQQIQSGTLQHSVMVLDLTLPGGLSGFEVLESVLSLQLGISVIACSGYFQEDARDLCQAIGFADILQKPYTPETLCATVRRCLSREPLPLCTPA